MRERQRIRAEGAERASADCGAGAAGGHNLFAGEVALRLLRASIYGVRAGRSGSEKYDETAAAMIAQLKDGSGTPFHRLEKLEGQLGMPLPAATQWEVVDRSGGAA